MTVSELILFHLHPNLPVRNLKTSGVENCFSEAIKHLAGEGQCTSQQLLKRTGDCRHQAQLSRPRPGALGAAMDQDGQVVQVDGRPSRPPLLPGWRSLPLRPGWSKQHKDAPETSLVSVQECSCEPDTQLVSHIPTAAAGTGGSTIRDPKHQLSCQERGPETNTRSPTCIFSGGVKTKLPVKIAAFFWCRALPRNSGQPAAGH